MSIGMDRLEKRLNRLERFLHRKRKLSPRKSAAVESGPFTSLSHSASVPTIQKFPTPSFIRPTSTRMLAREEVTLARQSARRTKSLPESPSDPYSPSFSNSEHGLRTGFTPRRRNQGPSVPQRSSSLVSRQMDASLAELLEFSFSGRSTRSHDELSALSMRRSRFGHKSPSRSTSISISPRAQPGRKRHPSLHIHTHLQTPLSLAQQHKSCDSMLSLSPTSLSLGQLTPAASPRLIPLPAPEPNELHEITLSPSRSPRSRIATLVCKKLVSELKTPVSGLSTERSAPSIRINTILREPSFKDFLALSDDDIADDLANEQSLSQTSYITSSGSSSYDLPLNRFASMSSPHMVSDHPLLTLSPPLASKPATIAAFEAARIASKYHFDLVYVVNLWPSWNGSSQSTGFSKRSSMSSLSTSTTLLNSPSSPSASFSAISTEENLGLLFPLPSEYRPMTGRLLAAYGLQSLMSPFRISAPVHRKILESDHWLEYRSDDAAKHEFAEGYSCSFYTGCTYPRPFSVLGEKAGRHGGVKNHGIVFAAYRLPHNAATISGSSVEELKELRKDAEALVNLALDTYTDHKEKRGDGTWRCTLDDDKIVPVVSRQLLVR